MPRNLPTPEARPPFSCTAATEALTDLGETSAAVADALRGYGIQGHAEQPDSCPLYRFLARCFLIPTSLHVEGDQLTWQIEGRIERCPLPSAAEDFVEDFDEGLYRDLEVVPRNLDEDEYDEGDD